MRFTCSRSALSDTLALLSDVVPARSAKPVLQNVKVTGNNDGSVTFSATDLEIALTTNIAVDELTDPCTVLLPAARFAGLIRDDWASTVTITAEDDRAEISTENGTFHLVGNASEEFPPIQEMPEKGLIEIAAEDLADAVRKTLFATAKGDTRYALNGILLHIEKKDVEFVSSDTHRLSLCRKKSRTAGTNAEAIVITKGMNLLARLAEDEEVIKLHLTAHELIASTSRATMVARLVDGQFPRYREVIPRDLENKVTLNRELFMKTLRLAGQMSNEETHSLTVSASKDTVVLSASGSESGDGRVDLPAEVTGEDVSANFNYIYLLDVLKVIEDETITLQFRDAESPSRLDVGDFTHIIMPIRPRDL